MATLVSTLRLPAEGRPVANSFTWVAEISESFVSFFRRRWVYQTTLSELQGYSEHNLRDLGAEYGIEEFARRAAGL